MSENMKRKQFHLSVAEEKLLYRLSEQERVSEAEIVRIAIRELANNRIKEMNSLEEMALKVRSSEAGKEDEKTPDLSANHDQFLQEAYEDHS